MVGAVGLFVGVASVTLAATESVSEGGEDGVGGTVGVGVAGISSG